MRITYSVRIKAKLLKSKNQVIYYSLPADKSISQNPSEKLAKGGIEKGDDGYYYGNILSNPVQDFQSRAVSLFLGKEMKQGLIKARLMPIKCPSEDSKDCSITDKDEEKSLHEVDEE